MTKGTTTLTITFLYLVDSQGNIFTTVARNELDLIEITGLVDQKGEPALFEGGVSRLKRYCIEAGIHYGEETRTFDFSTTVMTDVDKQWVANIFCWRQQKVEGLPLTQPRHLKPI